MTRRVHSQGVRERRRMTSSSPEPTHDVVAVSPEGEDLWITESYFSHHPEDPQVKFADDYAGISQRRFDGQIVDHFELRER